MPLEQYDAPGRRLQRNKSEDLPCKFIITAFEEKALVLMYRTSLSRHFINSDSEKVNE